MQIILVCFTARECDYAVIIWSFVQLLFKLGEVCTILLLCCECLFDFLDHLLFWCHMSKLCVYFHHRMSKVQIRYLIIEQVLAQMQVILIVHSIVGLSLPILL